MASGNLLQREVTGGGRGAGFPHQALELKTSRQHHDLVDGGNIAAALR
jgi:hypothetical protein